MVKDIWGQQAQAVIVVESPHTDEVDTGVPLSGVSGRIVSRTLIQIDTPIGPLCRNGAVSLSVVNTFTQPIKFDLDGANRPALLRDLNSLPFNDSAFGYKKDIKRILDAAEDRELVNSYAQRLTQALDAAKGKKLVVCGLIAQAVFEWAFNVNKTKFAAPFQCQFDSGLVNVFYIWHPSPKSGADGVGAWEDPYNSSAISSLTKFIGPVTLRRRG